MVRKMRRRVLAAALVTALTAGALGTVPASAGTAAFGASPSRPTTLGMIRLRSLIPGYPSAPMAIHGDIVVGEAVVKYDSVMVGADGAQWNQPFSHAVMWDLTDPEPSPTDFGTLGGEESFVTGFDGRWVVGYASTPTGAMHAFAVDLHADHPRITDLGTSYPNGSSRAAAIDDGVVVGYSAVGATSEAFAEDLDASPPRMVVLGHLGGGASEATAVRNGLVAGTATGADNLLHAFAVDLRSTDRTMRDLGALTDGHWTPHAIGPVAVERPVVVGTAETPGPAAPRHYHAFAESLTDPAPVMRAIGSGAPDSDSEPVDIRDGIAVGTEVQQAPDKGPQTYGFAYDTRTQRRRQVLLDRQARIFHLDRSGTALGAFNANGEHAFTFDATDPAPRENNLGLLSGSNPLANGADDTVIVGSVDSARPNPYEPSEHRDAAAWPVGNTIRLTRAGIAVSEAAGSASIPVVRTGDLSKPASVHYRAVGGTARAGRDFTGGERTLTFAAGQSRATIRIPVTDDSLAERSERFSVQLSAPSAGQRLLGLHTTVAIRTSDQRPDAEVSRSGHGYVGDDVYNGSGRHQTVTRSVRRGRTATYFVRLSNDGNSAIVASVLPGGTHKGLKLRYFHGTTGVTYEVTHGGWEPLLRPGRRVVLRVEVSPRRSVRPRTARVAKVALLWRGDHTWRDVVGTRVRILR